MEALILAGGIPQPDELLYAQTQGGYKVLMEIKGKTIIQWVMDALNSVSRISTVIIVGLPKSTPIQSKKRIIFLESAGDLLSNIQLGAEELIRVNPGIKHALLISGDIPGVRSEMIEHILDVIEKDPRDIYYSVVDRKLMDQAFPGSNRTFIKMKGMEVTGGDLSAFDPRVALDPDAQWRKLIAYRKTPLKQARLIGLGTLLLLATRNITLAELERKVCKKLRINGKVLLSPFAEVGMDVDKPNQLEMMRQYLARRASST